MSAPAAPMSLAAERELLRDANHRLAVVDGYLDTSPGTAGASDEIRPLLAIAHMLRGAVGVGLAAWDHDLTGRETAEQASAAATGR